METYWIKHHHPKACTFQSYSTVFENHLKSRIQHCERSELRLHFEWTKVHQKCQKCQKWSILGRSKMRHFWRFSYTVLNLTKIFFTDYIIIEGSSNSCSEKFNFTHRYCERVLNAAKNQIRNSRICGKMFLVTVFKKYEKCLTTTFIVDIWIFAQKRIKPASSLWQNPN